MESVFCTVAFQFYPYGILIHWQFIIFTVERTPMYDAKNTSAAHTQTAAQNQLIMAAKLTSFSLLPSYKLVLA
jgi:hypothetical protein